MLYFIIQFDSMDSQPLSSLFSLSFAEPPQYMYSHVPICAWMLTCTHMHTHTHALQTSNMELKVLVTLPIDHYLNSLAYASSLPSMSYLTLSPYQLREHFYILNYPQCTYTHTPNRINSFF